MPAFRWWEKDTWPADRHKPPARRGGDRAKALGRAGAAARGRCEPGQHRLGRRAPHAADDEHGARPRSPRADRPGLLRVLRLPLQRRADSYPRDCRHGSGAPLCGPAASPGRAAADRAQPGLRTRSRVGDGGPDRSPGAGGDRRSLRRAPGRLLDLPRLRRGRPSLGSRARRRARRPAAGGPRARAYRRRGRATRRGPTGSWSSPITGSRRARPSSTATG